VRDGKIVYAVGGKDFLWINPFTDHVDLEFMCGARLTSGDLKGRGKKSLVKHMTITTKKDINDAELKELIEDASKQFVKILYCTNKKRRRMQTQELLLID